MNTNNIEMTTPGSTEELQVIIIPNKNMNEPETALVDVVSDKVAEKEETITNHLVLNDNAAICIGQNDDASTCKTTTINNPNHAPSISATDTSDYANLLQTVRLLTQQFQATVEMNEKFARDLEESRKREKEMLEQSRKEREEAVRIQREYYRLHNDDDIEVEVGDDSWSMKNKKFQQEAPKKHEATKTKRKEANPIVSKSEDDGIFIDMPFLAEGKYDWIKIVTVENRYNRNRLRVAEDYLPLSQTISRETAIKRCRFLGLTTEDSDIEIVTIEMQNMRQSIRNTIKITLYKYWIDIANLLNFRVITQPGRPLRELDDVLYCIRTMQSQNDVRKVCKFCFNMV